MGKKKMAGHKRRMVGFTDQQWDWLGRERKRLGLPSISEFVRRIVDEKRFEKREEKDEA